MKVAKLFKMAQGKIMEGVFAINKPVGMSSAQVIRDCQNYLNPSNLFKPLLQHEKELRDRESKGQQKRRGRAKRDLRVKMGHGGTLDPLATGVLILGVGKGTKSLQNFLMCTKTYETIVLFGASTDTYDRVGRIIKKGPYDDLTRPMVEKALEGFRGRYKQMPPLYSALKMEGKPLYEYAREGKPIPREIPTREVDVTELELVEWYEPGTHEHRWSAEEADQTEKNLVDSVWRVAKKQASSEEEPRKLTPEQEEEETKALADYQSKKREAEERVDSLVKEENRKSPKRRKVETEAATKATEQPMMSGALGDLPPPPPAGRGSNLIPPPPAANTPPPWEGKGPPAAKIRMTVTSGFYVRSLCHDLGEKLGCGAMMAELVRSRQGDFVLGTANCMEYTDLIKGENVWGPKVEKALDLWNGVKTTTDGKAEAPKVEEDKEKPVPAVETKAEEVEAADATTSKPEPESESSATVQETVEKDDQPATAKL
ncbi:pseudouridine synthase [Diplogelasinospora grovesii]|uniref:tRNA pseudouridine(55) synthase n=1 Tax=Diplogelasinospora grovesii TaxID=303347 RepID=A0AAN6NI90_9PEZI|nr:pseudouridine synthase [Diplogelasinospora grovesii]